MPFARVDLQWGWPTQQLRFASLAHVEVLLDAYQATGDIAFLEGARDIVDAWAGFERSRVLPIGFLWNDHAIAQRVLVLTRYWSLLRGSPAFKPESARALLGFVQRSGLMLAKPGHFTVRTNHGVMQNLALLHVAAAFPALPRRRVSTRCRGAFEAAVRLLSIRGRRGAGTFAGLPRVGHQSAGGTGELPASAG